MRVFLGATSFEQGIKLPKNTLLEHGDVIMEKHGKRRTLCYYLCYICKHPIFLTYPNLDQPLCTTCGESHAAFTMEEDSERRATN